MSFGAKIRRLRQNKNMTQQELAEILSISTQAVSRWETDAAMPDISLLPVLCNYFGVTSDFLLEIDVARTKETISKILDEANKLSARGYLAEAKAILTDAQKKYPNSYEILMDIMYVAFNQFCRGADSAKKQELSEEVIMLGEKILEGCTDDTIRHAAIQVLCLQYPKCGKRDRARALAEKMPCIAMAKESLLPHIEDGDLKYKAAMNESCTLLQLLERNIASFNVKLDSGEWAFTPEERIVMMDKAIALIKLFFENGDYGFYNSPLTVAHTAQAWNFAKKADRDMTISHLKSAAEHAVGFIEFANTPNFVHTSLVFRGKSGGVFGTNASENSAQQLLNDMDDKTYDFIRNDAEFIRITEALKAYAAQWTV